MQPVTRLAIHIRPAKRSDIVFARELYFTTMRYIIEYYFGWDEQDQIRKFENQFVAEETQIVTLGDESVGWFQLAELENHIFLKQMYVHPHYQRQGIGAALIERIIDQARAVRKPVRLGVVKINPARRLYERAGFRLASEDEYKFYMERSMD